VYVFLAGKFTMLPDPTKWELKIFNNIQKNILNSKIVLVLDSKGNTCFLDAV